MTQKNIHDLAYQVIIEPVVDVKLELAQVAAKSWKSSHAEAVDPHPAKDIVVPGRPDKPHLVSPHQLAQRGLGTLVGRAAFIHAITHIEFNAINLAFDAVYRFQGLPKAYYSDWMDVAMEEVKHFTLLNSRLTQLGFQYGDFDAHNGLWDAAVSTAHDLKARMAIVPRVLEARGLDVTPRMIHRLNSVGDTESAAILELILEEELGHVAKGAYWFNYLCEQENLQADVTFVRLVKDHFARGIGSNLNIELRKKAGFTEFELDALAQLAKKS